MAVVDVEVQRGRHGGSSFGWVLILLLNHPPNRPFSRSVIAETCLRVEKNGRLWYEQTWAHAVLRYGVWNGKRLR